MSNTNLVTNLNADLLDGKEGTYYTEYTDTAISNIQVGGRNLVRGSAFLDLSQFTNIGANVSIDATNKINGLNSVKSIQSGLSDYSFRGLTSKISAKTGDTFALTIYSFTDNISSFDEFARCEVLCLDGNGTRVFPNGTTIDILPTANNVWQKNTSIFTITATNVVEIWVQPYVAKNGRLWFGGIKLERGNKATGWSPAPEDHISDWLTTDVNSFSYIKNKPTTLSGYGITDALLASAYTASDVLTKLKTVDGSGSGLDADLLDGFHAGGVSGAYWSKIPVVGADGVMEVGAYLDFHEANTGTSNYDGRLSSAGTAAFWNGNRMWHAANSNLSTIDWAAKNITVATDIITNFNTWTNGNSKSLDKFLKLFDIDSNGNLVVKTNLYSTGEVTAYSSGTGVSGLKLMADMNANGKAIYSVNYLQAGLSVQGGNAIIGSDPLGLFGTGMSVGLYNTDNDTVIAAYDDYNGMFYYANTSVTFSNYTNTLQAPAFKFGNWTFRQDASGRLGIYNGATEVACFNTDGTYVNL